MSKQWSPTSVDTHVLHGRAIRIPLPTEEAERQFHRNMETVATAQERKAELLADPTASILEAFEQQLEGIAQSYEYSLVANVGEDYESIAREYVRGERTDGVAAMAAYLQEALWRLEQLFSVTEGTFFPVILRYPRCCTVNIRFTDEYVTTNSILYESPEHSCEDLDEEYAETYHGESYYSQKQAAEHIAATAQIIRDEFPDPRDVDFEERKTGGIVSAVGRRGSEFSSALESVEPDPARFDDAIAGPELVEESPIAKRTERDWLSADAVVF